MPGALVVGGVGLDEAQAALDGDERQLQVAAAVLVVHRELAPAFRLPRLARLLPQLRRARVVARALGAPAEAQQGRAADGRRPEGERAPVLGFAALVEPAALEHAAEAEDVARVLGARLLDPLARQDRERGQRDDVLAVVLEDARQQRARRGA